MSTLEPEERLDCGVEDCRARGVIEHAHTGVYYPDSRELLTCSTLPPGVFVDLDAIHKLRRDDVRVLNIPDDCRLCRLAQTRGGLACLEHLTTPLV